MLSVVLIFDTNFRNHIWIRKSEPVDLHPCCRLRLAGSTALDMSCVAAARCDAYFQVNGVHCWDYAAGDLLVREAGGCTMDVTGWSSLQSVHVSFPPWECLHRCYPGIISDGKPEMAFDGDAVLYFLILFDKHACIPRRMLEWNYQLLPAFCQNYMSQIWGHVKYVRAEFSVSIPDSTHQ